MRSIAISSGHGAKVQGAVGYIKEHESAVKVVDRIVLKLQMMKVPIVSFEDKTSTTQQQNLNTIVAWHNAQKRDLDVSIHFNANVETQKPMGVETLYVTQRELAAKCATAASDAAGLINRGPKHRDNLAFLNGTTKPALLHECLFVDSRADVDIFENPAKFDAMCQAIAETISDAKMPAPTPEPKPPGGPLFVTAGRCSWFGGPHDTGVSPSEGLAFIFKYEDAPHLFLPQQPPGTTGLARRLNVNEVNYVACRWDYEVTSKKMLADKSIKALVRAGEKEVLAWPADWGPHQDTGRVADISLALMKALRIETDDVVEVIYPAPSEAVVA